jgi:hypothetical protein
MHRYSRIVARIHKELRPNEGLEARTILELVGCSLYPLTNNEIRLAVSILGGFDPSKGTRELFLDIIQRCGPIIELFQENVRFVHFTAKE